MEYIYPPLYKYLALILIFFMFVRHYKSIDQESYLLLCFVFMIMAIMMDYYLIEYHPGLFKTANFENFDDLEENDDSDLVELLETKDDDNTVQNKNDDDDCTADNLDLLI